MNGYRKALTLVARTGSTLLSCLLATVASAAHAMDWPGSAVSAVSITADDGWDTQLQQADILDTYGFKGTFYLTGAGLPTVQNHIPQWKSVFTRGHEIGNHTWSHWSAATVQQKTWQEVAGDIGTMEQWLLTNIFDNQPQDHSYAYPEGYYRIGPATTSQERTVGACQYAGLLSAVVSAARTGDGAANDPAGVTARRFFIRGFPVTNGNVADAKAAIDAGIANGTWTVLIFHSLNEAGDGNSITEANYRDLLTYIQQKQSQLWVAPAMTVARHVFNNTPYSDFTCNP